MSRTINHVDDDDDEDDGLLLLSMEDEEEEDEGVESDTGVLVDWSGTVSLKSMGSRRHRVGVGGGSAKSLSAQERNAISLYDSDSSDELRQRVVAQRSSSLLAKLTQVYSGDDEQDLEDDDDDDDDDEEVSVVDDCMILTDDEDEVEDDDDEEDDDEEEELGWSTERIQATLSTAGMMSPQEDETPVVKPAPVRRLSTPTSTSGTIAAAMTLTTPTANTTTTIAPATISAPIQTPSSSKPTGRRARTSSPFGRHRERGTMSAIFAEDKPWRRTTRDTVLLAGDSPIPAIPKPSRARRSISNPLKLLQERKKSPRSRSISVSTTTTSTGDDETAGVELQSFPNGSNHNEVEPDWSSEDHDDDEEDDLEDLSMMHTQLTPLDLSEVVDWNNLPTTPNSFLGSGKFHPSMAHYLDEELRLTERDADRFVTEHSLLLRAILQLLGERDGQQDWDDTSLILKQGSLKKSSSRSSRPRRTWKYRYVEVRQGVFAYYEDGTASQQSRRTVSLADCIVRPVDSPKQFVFEMVSDNRRLFWMTSSDEERQSWLKALEEAKQKKRGPINLQPYQNSIERFQALQTNLRWSVSKSDYMVQFGDIHKLKFQIPVAWVSSLEEGGNHAPMPSSTTTKRSKNNNNIADFWKFLQKHTVGVNGHMIPAESAHGPERIIGAVSRCILEYDRSSSEEHALHNMSEAQALVYTRDILMSVWRSRARDEAHTTLDALCKNPNLVIVLPASSDPTLHLRITYTTHDDLEASNHEPTPSPSTEISGWVTTRSKSFKNWKNRFCVVSDGVLSYYEQAQPRPHGLRGQLVLIGAAVNVLKEKHLFVVQIVTKDQERERQLSFRDESIFLEWKDAIQRAIDASSSKSPTQSPGRKRKNAGRILTESGGRIIKGGVEGGFKAIKGASGLIARGIRKNHQAGRRPSISSLWTSEPAPKLEPPSVQVLVESTRMYKIITADPTGDEQEDTWVTARAKTSQHFRLSGGEHGRIIADEEIVLIEFVGGVSDFSNLYNTNLDDSAR